jgi:hypothetical protein
MTPSTLTPRQSFREAVADVAARAKERLPQAVNGRVESAVKLVLAHDVTPEADGSITVGSSTDPLKFYRLQGTACECQDFTRGQAPEGRCQHRIAAGIHKRVQEMLGQAGETAPVTTTDAPRSPLPEAPASANCHLMLEGRQIQLTLRDTDEARLLERLQAVLAQYPVAQSAIQAPSQGQGEGKGWCAVHNVAMKLQQKGERAWYSHRTDDGFCKGR